MLLAFVIAYVAYALLAQTGVSWWDTGEAQAVPPMLGIMHPPGFPFYTLFGFAWSHLFPFGSYAYRMTTLSGVCAAAATSVLVATLWEFRVRTPLALTLALTFSLNPIVFEHVIRAGAEGTFALCASLSVYYAIRVFLAGSVRDAFICGLAFAALLGTHLIAIYVFPGLLLLIAGRARMTPLRIFVATALVASACIYAYLPLRSIMVVHNGLDPSVSLGLPQGQSLFNYDNPGTISGFRTTIFGEQFGAGGSSHAFLNVAAYPTYLKFAIDIVSHAFGPLAPFILIVAFASFARRQTLLAIAIGSSGFLMVPFAATYGALIDPPKYFVFSTWICVLLIGAALGHTKWDLRSAPRKAIFPIALSAIFVVSVAGAACAHWSLYSARQSSNGSTVLDEVRSFTPSNAIIDAAFVYATPLMYGAYTSHELEDRSVVMWGPTSSPSEAFANAWSQRRPVFLIPFTKADLPKGVTTVVVPHSWPTMYRVIAPL